MQLLPTKNGIGRHGPRASSSCCWFLLQTLPHASFCAVRSMSAEASGPGRHGDSTKHARLRGVRARASRPSPLLYRGCCKTSKSIAGPVLEVVNECEAGNFPPDTGGVAAPSRKDA